jgi:hypothetical protein
MEYLKASVNAGLNTEFNSGLGPRASERQIYGCFGAVTTGRLPN